VLAGVTALALTAGVTGGLAGRVAADHSKPTALAIATPAAATQPSISTTAVGAIVAKIEPSVVAIDVTYQSGRSSGTASGTGIILTANGLVVTNAHVVAGATSVQVTVAGESTPRAATVIGSDTAADIALVQITGASGLTPAELGNSSSVAVGDDVVAVGNALALAGGPTVTRGIVSAVNRSIDTGTGTMAGLIQTDAAISSGNSGGPLVNASGQVIGINAVVATGSQTTAAENIGFAIAIDTVKPVIQRLEAGAVA
jgi:putative serine protease PepD